MNVDPGYTPVVVVVVVFGGGAGVPLQKSFDSPLNPGTPPIGQLGFISPGLPLLMKTGCHFLMAF